MQPRCTQQPDYTADLDDILDAMEKLDGQQALPNFYCEADDLLYLPHAVLARSVSVEMLNLSDKIDQLQKQYQQLQVVICHKLRWHCHQQLLAKMT